MTCSHPFSRFKINYSFFLFKICVRLVSRAFTHTCFLTWPPDLSPVHHHTWISFSAAQTKKLSQEKNNNAAAESPRQMAGYNYWEITEKHPGKKHIRHSTLWSLVHKKLSKYHFKNHRLFFSLFFFWSCSDWRSHRGKLAGVQVICEYRNQTLTSITTKTRLVRVREQGTKSSSFSRSCPGTDEWWMWISSSTVRSADVISRA